jgi:SagB-type dehydrogenase family enzyme
MNQEHFVIDRLVRIRWGEHEGQRVCVLTTPRTRRRYEISAEMLPALLVLLEPRSLSDCVSALRERAGVDPAEADRVVDTMRNAGLLIPINIETYALWRDRGWATALHFHLMTRDALFVDSGQPEEEKDRERTLREYAREYLPDFYKTHAESAALPRPSVQPVPAGPTLLQRRTSRNFGTTPISLDQLAILLERTCQPARLLRERARQGTEANPLLWTASKYTPFELYFAVGEIPGLDAGIYHYDMQRHAVHLLRAGDHRTEMKQVAIGQGVDRCSVVFLFTACFPRYAWRYRCSRALRNVYIECASLAHRLLLVAQALGLKSFLTPALRDAQADKLLGIDGFNEGSTYLVGVGTR